MNNTSQYKIKTEHASDCTCSICGFNYKGFPFKQGYVCESCLEYIKDSCSYEKNTAGQNT